MRLRSPLAYSLLLNGILAGNYAYQALAPAPKPSPSRASAVVTAPLPSPPPLPAPSSQPFVWSSLESEDYPTYIANLRKIGCPEQTIRDIISADLENLYASKQTALSAKVGTEAFSWAQELLRKEKLALLEQLLSPSASPGEIIATASIPSATPSPSTTTAASAKPTATATSESSNLAPCPLVFQPVPHEAIQLTDRENAILEGLRKSFIREIGGPNQAPNNPVYLERWKQASEAADLRIQTLLGPQFYTTYQQAAARQKAKASSL